MKTILFTNARDESNILEWVIHHKNIGFDHIFIFDHKSIVQISILLHGLDYVTVYRVEQDFVPKTKLMLEASKIAKKKHYDWMLYLDCDEFLALPLYPNVSKFIENYPKNSQICVNWVMYGSNFLIEEPVTTILESYTKYEGGVNKHVKSFVKPQLVVSVKNPHYYVINEKKHFTSGVRLNKHDFDEPYFYTIEPNASIHTIGAFVAHYNFQSYNTYLKRRGRTRDDANVPYGNLLNKDQLNGVCNNCETTLIRDLYNENNKIKIQEFLNLNTLKIFYGVFNNLVDVTDICLAKLTTHNIITIPHGDINRASHFKDHLVGVLKSIIIKNNNLVTSYDCLTEIKINTLNNVVSTTNLNDINNKLKNLQTKLNINHGSFCEELPEQQMVVRYLTGDENVLEIGGNIGRNSLIIASILKNNDNFVTLECDVNIAKQLTENRNLNNFKFHIEQTALSNRKLIQQGWETFPSDTLKEGFNWVNTITLNELKNKYNIVFDTLVLDCEGAFYYILMDMPEILNNINLIIMENDYHDLSHKQYIDKILNDNMFYLSYVESGGWGPCQSNFFEVWKKH